jgi:creatinine amidohydrolase/Fe(II)-dependent formamide hydrolase-like protein
MPDATTRRLDLMTSKEAAAYLARNDLAILPVGCTEMHGPLLPLGTDTFQDHAMALLLAERWDAVCLPPIPYVYTGASEQWPGTLSISPEESIRYVRAVALSAVRAGFARLVVLASHGPMGFMAETLVRGVFHETGEILLFLSPYGRIMEQQKAAFGHGSEDANTMGALKVLGLDAGFDFRADRDTHPSFPFESMTRLRALGARMPWIFNRDDQHVGMRSDLGPEDADRAVACMREAADALRDVPELFAQYRREMKALLARRPWSRDDVWTA